jgi:hypothetical protein
MVAVIFGIGWTVLAVSLTREAPFPAVRVFFPLFGFLFVIIGIANVAYNLRNTAAKDRFSIADITTEEEESDPLNERFGRGTPPKKSSAKSVAERLAEIDQLKASGAISEEEHQSQRQRILDQV